MSDAHSWARRDRERFYHLVHFFRWFLSVHPLDVQTPSAKSCLPLLPASWRYPPARSPWHPPANRSALRAFHLLRKDLPQPPFAHWVPPPAGPAYILWAWTSGAKIAACYTGWRYPRSQTPSNSLCLQIDASLVQVAVYKGPLTW